MRNIAKEAREAGVLNNDEPLNGMPRYGESSNFHPIHLLVGIVLLLALLGCWVFFGPA